jgi:hypothetical protein
MFPPLVVYFRLLSETLFDANASILFQKGCEHAEFLHNTFQRNMWMEQARQFS